MNVYTGLEYFTNRELVNHVFLSSSPDKMAVELAKRLERYVDSYGELHNARDPQQTEMDI